MIGSVFHITSEDMSTTEGQNCYGTADRSAIFKNHRGEGPGDKVAFFAPSWAHVGRTLRMRFYSSRLNLVARAHVPFGQHQDTELWNNQFPETKILGLPASQRMRGLV